ncbi:outer dynein arm-docking complex subunit 4 isoform X8 [Carcharodon carcharias]|uniref:outer dynein arm-docking complex subunit 4 isoform X8 n=1 Tax=Carcharodon carcharias TaxID=13397 RepID=UPI001B7F5BF0|nr:outer dynein arm-docking complex subunit 4 isoform X8 [Carcharodon carcharias]
MADDEEEILSGPICSYLTYKSEGDRLYMLGEYEKAINSYSHALQQEPKNRNCLVARSRCYLAVGNTTLALKDAEASQLGNKEFYKGLYRKAETLYAKGEFELALMFYHRGHKLRPDDHNFRLGIQKAREAIDNSVGSPSSVKLETKGDLSFFYRREEKVVPKTKSQLRRQKLNLKRQSMKPEQDEPKTNKTVRVLLGELYGDKEYLEKLLLDKELMKTSTESGGTIQDLIMSGIAFLDTRTEFWRQQKPIFAREREQRIKAQSWKSQRKQAESEQTTFILEHMEEIDMLLADGYAEVCKNKAMELVQIVKEWSQREVPNKAEFLGNLYNTIGLAQVELGEFEDALASHHKDLQIAKKYDNLEAKSRALDNIGRVYARIGEFAKAVEAWSEKEPLTKSHLERTWLFHEIGRCHLELGNNVEARDYGLKALASAQKTGDEEWKMNANVLVAQAELKQNKLQTAVTFFEQAMSKARMLNDEPAQEAISNALKDSKTQIELAEKAKQEEVKELEEKQKAHRLKLGPVVVGHVKTEKQKRTAFMTEDISSHKSEDISESTLYSKGPTVADEGSKPEKTEDLSENDDSQCSTSTDSVCGFPSSHVSDSSLRARTTHSETEAAIHKLQVTQESSFNHKDSKEFDEELKQELSVHTRSSDANQLDGQLSENTENEGVISEETKTQSDDKEFITEEVVIEKGETTAEVIEKGETADDIETEKGETAEEVTEKRETEEEVTENGETADNIETEKGETEEEMTEKGEATEDAETEKGETKEEVAAPKNE